MPRLRLKAFDPHNPDVKARQHWERLQRGEHRHAYDQPPTKAQQRRDHQQRPSLALRRFQAQVAAAKALKGGKGEKREPAKADTELTDGRKQRKRRKRDREEEVGKDGDNGEKPQSKREQREEDQRQVSEQERREEEQMTRKRWEDQANRMTAKHPTPSTSASASAFASPAPTSPVPREFAAAEVIPFGTQVDRPPQHLPALKLRHLTTRSTPLPLSIADYAAERQRAQAAYDALRLKRRSAAINS